MFVAKKTFYTGQPVWVTAGRQRDNTSLTMQAISQVSHAFDSTLEATLTSAGRTRCFGLYVKTLSRIFKQPGERIAERLEYTPPADTVDTNDRIVSLAAEMQANRLT